MTDDEKQLAEKVLALQDECSEYINKRVVEVFSRSNELMQGGDAVIFLMHFSGSLLRIAMRFYDDNEAHKLLLTKFNEQMLDYLDNHKNGCSDCQSSTPHTTHH